jgi:hypothetical protein
MNVPTLIVSAILVMLFGSLIGATILAYAKNGALVRRILRRRLGETRLKLLMRRMEVDPYRYVDSYPIVYVNRHLDACASCPHTARCDEAMSQPPGDACHDFCPHIETIRNLRQQSS